MGETLSQHKPQLLSVCSPLPASPQASLEEEEDRTYLHGTCTVFLSCFTMGMGDKHGGKAGTLAWEDRHGWVFVETLHRTLSLLISDLSGHLHSDSAPHREQAPGQASLRCLFHLSAFPSLMRLWPAPPW